MTRGTTHKPRPQYIEMFHRYQCAHCHSWVNYDESVGHWFHQGKAHEEMKRWSWDGSVWSYAKEPQP